MPKWYAITEPYQRSSWDYNDYGSDVEVVEAPTREKAKAMALRMFRAKRSAPILEAKNPFSVFRLEPYDDPS